MRTGNPLAELDPSIFDLPTDPLASFADLSVCLSRLEIALEAARHVDDESPELVLSFDAARVCLEHRVQEARELVARAVSSGAGADLIRVRLEGLLGEIQSKHKIAKAAVS